MLHLEGGKMIMKHLANTFYISKSMLRSLRLKFWLFFSFGLSKRLDSMPEWSHFPRHRRQPLHLVPAVRLRLLRHETWSHWSSPAFLQQRWKLLEHQAELVLFCCLAFLSSGFPGLLGHGIYPWSHWQGPADPVCLLPNISHPQDPVKSSGSFRTPTASAGLHTHLNQSMPGAVWAVSSDVILQYLQGISSGIQVCSSPLCKLLQYLLITYAHSPLL